MKTVGEVEMMTFNANLMLPIKFIESQDCWGRGGGGEGREGEEKGLKLGILTKRSFGGGGKYVYLKSKY